MRSRHGPAGCLPSRTRCGQRAGAVGERASARHPSATARSRAGPVARSARSGPPTPLGLRRTGRRRDRAPAWLFNDTFTNYFHPEIGLAARDVLKAAGLAVGLAANGCCGRPLISQGLLKEARELARRNTRYFSCAPEGPPEGGLQPLVFLEPSCLSAMREDVPALLRGEEQQQALRSLSHVSRSRSSSPGRSASSTPSDGPSRILLHGHCHQKSMGGLPPAKSLLERIPGSDGHRSRCRAAAAWRDRSAMRVSTSRCRGRSASAGSCRPPAGLKDGEVLVAAGTSCRQQVSDFTGVRALHPAELLRSLLS